MNHRETKADRKLKLLKERREEGQGSVKQYIPGTDPLAPVHYTDAERAELLSRIRQRTDGQALRAARQRWATRSPASTPQPRITRYRTTTGRVAARLAMLAHCSPTEAAWMMRGVGIYIAAGTAVRQWRQIYPGVPTNPARRGRR